VGEKQMKNEKKEKGSIAHKHNECGAPPEHAFFMPCSFLHHYHFLCYPFFSTS